jgi:hypothetical protein
MLCHLWAQSHEETNYALTASAYVIKMVNDGGRKDHNRFRVIWLVLKRGLEARRIMPLVSFIIADRLLPDSSPTFPAHLLGFHAHFIGRLSSHADVMVFFWTYATDPHGALNHGLSGAKALRPSLSMPAGPRLACHVAQAHITSL